MSIVRGRKILVVDDVELNRAILYELFCNDYEVIEAENGKEALDMLGMYANEISVVLLDMVMPVMDGLVALEKMREQGFLRDIPVVMVTAESTEGRSLKMYELGASDVITKPFNVAVVRQRIDNIIELYDYRRNLEEIVRKQTITLEEQARKLKNTNVFVIDTLCTAVEFRNGESGTHILRIRDITRLMFKELGARHIEYALPDSRIDIISNAAAMHDIGKIAVPDAILNKPGKLTPEEFDIMKQHTIKGCELLEKLDYVQDKEYYGYCYEICRHHHERWDGNGYPDGLVGDDIPIWSQVVSMADVYDALVSERPYKRPFSHEKAMNMILDGECGVFNPLLLSCLKDISDKLKAMYRHISESTQSTFTPLTVKPPKPTGNVERVLKLLEIERAKYHIIADSTGDIVFEYDVENDNTLFSENVVNMLNSDIELKGIMTQGHEPGIIHPKDYKLLKQAFTEIAQQEMVMARKTIRLMTKKGHYEWFEVIAKGFFDDEDGTVKLTNIVGKLVNIDALKNEAAHWRTEAQRDALTGLCNRRAFQELVQTELKRNSANSGAMLFIDVDNFKSINDTYGHQCGDRILTIVGERIKAAFRSTDITGRIGGDEFVVFLTDLSDMSLLKSKASQFCDAIRNAQATENLECAFTVSLGIARYPDDAPDYQTLIRYADEALYFAKSLGRNQFVFYSQIDKI